MLAYRSLKIIILTFVSYHFRTVYQGKKRAKVPDLLVSMCRSKEGNWGNEIVDLCEYLVWALLNLSLNSS